MLRNSVVHCSSLITLGAVCFLVAFCRRGKCVSTIHFYGDQLWASGTREQMPDLPPPHLGFTIKVTLEWMEFEQNLFLIGRLLRRTHWCLWRCSDWYKLWYRAGIFYRWYREIGSCGWRWARFDRRSKKRNSISPGNDGQSFRDSFSSVPENYSHSQESRISYAYQ